MHRSPAEPKRRSFYFFGCQEFSRFPHLSIRSSDFSLPARACTRLQLAAACFIHIFGHRLRPDEGDQPSHPYCSRMPINDIMCAMHNIQYSISEDLLPQTVQQAMLASNGVRSDGFNTNVLPHAIAKQGTSSRGPSSES